LCNQVSLPDEVEYILKRLSVPPRLYAHSLVVHDVAHTLIKAITDTWDNLNIDENLILFGAATHDIGKCIHINELSENKIRATKLSSTGGFFRKGNTTILIGIEEEKLDRVKEMILNISKNKETVDDKTANTVMFVLNMDQFIRV